MGGNCGRFSLVGIQICGSMTGTRPPPLPPGTRGFFFEMISELRSFPQPQFSHCGGHPICTREQVPCPSFGKPSR